MATTQTKNEAAKKFEVQTLTLCDGWTNCWTVSDQNGNEQQLETFSREAEAQAAIDEFLADIQADIDAGDRQSDEGYDPSEFRIVQIHS